MHTTQKIDYKKAGVNIDERNKLVKSIGDLVQQTARPGAFTTLGSFGSIFDLQSLGMKDPLLISGTDGVGTKLKLATALNKHSTIGQDLVAMCVNDILCHGAEPLFFLDYFATSKLERAQAHEVIAGIAQACKQCNCALIGGETAEMPGMYNPHEYDLAGFVVGIVERTQLLPKRTSIKPGDVVIGLESSGPHSNGYSLIRKILEINRIPLDQPPPFESKYKTMGELLLEPTNIYTSALLPLIKQNLLKGIAHITGGGLLENIPRMLPRSVAVELNRNSWPIPEVFNWIQSMAKIDHHEMQRTFNLGIGMVIIVDTEHQEQVVNHLNAREHRAHRIGKVVCRKDKPSQVLW